MEIIPALNCLDAESLGQWLEKAGSFLPPGGWIHLDLSDGKFTPVKTWNEPAAWQELAGRYNFNLEAHLMVEDPFPAAQAWLEAGAKRVIVQVETITPASLQEIFQAGERYKADIMLSLGLETPIEVMRPYIHATRYFQVMSIIPGPSGQKFSPLALEKIAFLRAVRSNAKIEVDGGMNPETARLCKEAGVDFAAAGSYIFWGSDPAGAYEELLEAIGN